MASPPSDAQPLTRSGVSRPLAILAPGAAQTKRGRVLPPAGQPSATNLSPQQVAKARKAAQDFEAMAIGQFLAPMFNTVDLSNNLFGGGAGEQQWRPMLTDELAKQIAKAGGIGIADTVLQQMLRTQEQGRTK